MFEKLGSTYQMHIVTEADRPWLEEALVNVSGEVTVDNAIKWGQSYNPKKPNFIHVSIITSRQDDNIPIMWSYVPVQKVGKTNIIHFEYSVMHPSFRGLGYSNIALEFIEWLVRENWWKVDMVQCTQSPWLEDVPLSWGPYVKKSYSDESGSAYHFDLRAVNGDL